MGNRPERPDIHGRVNGWLTIFWIVMIPVSIVLGWITSVAYVSALSLWALVSGHWAAWQAARVEFAQERDREAREKGEGDRPTAGYTVDNNIRGRPGLDVVGSPAELQVEDPGRPR